MSLKYLPTMAVEWSRRRHVNSIVMPKPGIRIISETVGAGPEIKKGDRIIITYDILLTKGDVIVKDQGSTLTLGDRNFIAGLRYGIEGMKVGGTRKFKASPHLCYRDQGTDKIPKNSVLIFDIKSLDVLA